MTLRPLGAPGGEPDPDLTFDDDFAPQAPQTVRDNPVRVTAPPGGGAPATNTSGAPAQNTNVAGGNEILQQFPGEGEVWQVDGVLYLVWFIPDTQPPVPMLWEVTPDLDLGAVNVDKVLTQSQADQAGALFTGSARNISNRDTHPYESFLDIIESESPVRPWIMEPDFLALFFSAYLEGRAMTTAEIQSTQWWQTHNAEERAWIELRESDPESANKRLEDARLLVASALREAGINNAPEELIAHLADQFTTGAWSQTYLNEQIRLLSDPFATGSLDAGVQDVLSGVGVDLDTTIQQQADVRALVSRWLGPAYGAGWTEQNIAEWAGKFRNDPDAEDHLVELLRQQRLALFPGYENPDLTYQDIAAPWRSFFMTQWGQAPKELDPLFLQIVNMNDAGKAATLLRKEGLAQGNQTVVSNAVSALGQAVGSNVRRSDPAVL